MKRRQIILLAIIMTLTMGVFSSQATLVQLELYNTYALIDENNVNLVGDASSGDLVQVILAGSGIDAPDVYGNPGGDDVLMFTLHVGTGIPVPGTGLLDAFPLNYDSAMVTSNIYVRFWNAASVASATYYGNSSIFQLPPGDPFGLTNLDFTPLESSPHQTNQPFNALVIPEPSNLFLFGLIAFAGFKATKRRK
jgi:hypothetical protein